MTDKDYESMSLFPNVYTSLYASLYRLFQDPYKIPTESDMSDRIQALDQPEDEGANQGTAIVASPRIIKEKNSSYMGYL